MAKPNHIVTYNYQQFAKIAVFSNYREAYIAAVTVSELLTGVHLATNPVQRIHRSAFVESIIAQIPVLDFNQEVARVYAELYAFFLSHNTWLCSANQSCR